MTSTESVERANRPAQSWFETLDKELADIELILTALARNETIRCTECGHIDTSGSLVGISALTPCECPSGNN